MAFTFLLLSDYYLGAAAVVVAIPSLSLTIFVASAAGSE